jgi:hydrogenase maturation protease
MAVSRPILVLGLGNSLQGDDGLSGRAVELLAQRELPAQTTVEAGGTPGWGLATRLQGWQQVILVDAAELGLHAGEWRRISLEDVHLEAGQRFLSLHNPGVVEGLALARSLGVLPECLILYCMQPGRTDMGIGLSPAVEAGLPGLVEDIFQELWKRQA